MKPTTWLLPAVIASVLLSVGLASAQDAPPAVNINPCTHIAWEQSLIPRLLQNYVAFEDLGIAELGCGTANRLNFKVGAKRAVCAILLDAGAAFATAAALQLSAQDTVKISETNRVDAMRDWGLARTAYQRAYSAPCSGIQPNAMDAVQKAADAEQRMLELARQISSGS